MKEYLSKLISLQLLLYLSVSLACNASHLNFVSKFSLGKQDQFNRTFQKIQTNISTLNQFNYTVPLGEYRIFDIKISYFYRDSKQFAQFRGSDVIIIEGGSTQIRVDFNWTKKYFTIINGSGSAFGLSHQLMLAKKLVIDNKSYSYQLLSVMPFVMPVQKAFQFTRIDPPNVSDNDQAALLSMFNKLDSKKDIKTVIEIQIQKVYENFLSDSLHDQHFPISLEFNYTWVSQKAGKPNITIPFVRRPVSVDVQPFGLISSFDIQITNDSSWQCDTRKVPDLPLDSTVFGGIQEFINFNFYKNVIRWALDNNVLDTDLNKQNWGYRMFDFFAGDLFEVFPSIPNKYYASDTVQGKCLGSSTGLNVTMNNNETFIVNSRFECFLLIKAEKIIDFTVELRLTIAGQPTANFLNFRILNHSQIIYFKPTSKYPLGNQRLAEAMIGDSLNRIYEGNLFGSGWPQSPPKDYPHFRVFQNYTAVFDTAQYEYASPVTLVEI